MVVKGSQVAGKKASLKAINRFRLDLAAAKWFMTFLLQSCMDDLNINFAYNDFFSKTNTILHTNKKVFIGLVSVLKNKLIGKQCSVKTAFSGSFYLENIRLLVTSLLSYTKMHG